MRMTLAPFALTLLIAGCGSVAGAEPTTRLGEVSQAVFPVQYQGAWDFSDGGCVNVLSDARLVISADEINGYEDTSILKALEVIGHRGDTIRVELENQSSEGDIMITQTLRLEGADGSKLRIVQEGMTRLATRCGPQ